MNNHTQNICVFTTNRRKKTRSNSDFNPISGRENTPYFYSLKETSPPNRVQSVK